MEGTEPQNSQGGPWRFVFFGGSVREEEVITNLSLRSILKRIGGQARLTDEVIDVYKYTFLYSVHHILS